MSDLTDSVEKLTSAVNVLGKQIRQIRRRQWGTIASLALDLILSIGLTFSIVAIERGNEARQRETNTARVASCKQYNVQQSAQRDAEIAQSHDFVDALTKGIPDPTRRAEIVAAYNGPHDRLVRRGHALRRCSPAAIRQFLSNTTTTSPKGTP